MGYDDRHHSNLRISLLQPPAVSSGGFFSVTVWMISGVVLAACGGGGGGGGVTVTSPSGGGPSSGRPPAPFQAYATDGPVANASFYAIESDGSRTFAGMTNADGQVNIAPEHRGKELEVVVNGAIDTPSGRRLTGKWRSLPMDQYDEGEPIVVSPITDLVARHGPNVLSSIFGSGTVTIDDITELGNYDTSNPRVEAQLIATAAIAATEMQKNSSLSNAGGAPSDTGLKKLQDLFSPYRAKSDKSTFGDADLGAGSLKSAVKGITGYLATAAQVDNNDIQLSGDLKAEVGPGGTYTITSADLAAIDGNTPAHRFVYTITQAPADGTLKKGTAVLGVGDTFTQADINAGRVTYEHGGISPSQGMDALFDEFGFTLQEMGSSESVNGSFSIDVNPPAGSPPQSVNHWPPFIISAPDGRIDDGEGQTTVSGMIDAFDPDGTIPTIMIDRATQDFSLSEFIGGAATVSRDGFTYGEMAVSGNLWTFNVQGDGLALLHEGEQEVFNFKATVSDGVVRQHRRDDTERFSVTLIGKDEAPPPAQGAPEPLLGLPGSITLGPATGFLKSGFGDHLLFDTLDASSDSVEKYKVVLVDGVWGTNDESTKNARVDYLALTLKTGISRSKVSDLRAADVSQLEIAIGGARITVYHESKTDGDGRSVEAGDIRFEFGGDNPPPVINFKGGISLVAVDATSLARVLPGLDDSQLATFDLVTGNSQGRPASPVFTLTTDADSDGKVSVGDTIGIDTSEVTDNPNARLTFEWGHSFTQFEDDAPLATGATFTPTGPGTYHARITDTSIHPQLAEPPGHWAVYVAPSTTVDPNNEAPTLSGDLTASEVFAKLVYNFTHHDLQAVDGDNTPDQLTYTITREPLKGRIEHAVRNTWEETTTFTQQEINDGDVRYVHLGDAPGVFRLGTDSFQFTLSDGTATPLIGRFDIEISKSHVSSSPVGNVVLGGDLTANLAKGETYTITDVDLVGIDANTPLHLVDFWITATPTSGTLRKGAEVLGVRDYTNSLSSFTQEDINEGRITYEHDGSSTATDSITLYLIDYGIRTGSPVEGTLSFEIDVM